MMSPRNLILLGVAALAGSGLVLGFVAGAPDEDALRGCIAKFLEIDPDAMEVRIGSTDGHGRTEVRVRLDDETRVTFRTRQIEGRLSVIRMLRHMGGGEAEEDIGVDRARAIARAFAEKKYGRWGPDMVETRVYREPGGRYGFIWKRLTEEGYETGDEVSVRVAVGNGEVLSYGAGYATRSVRPRIDAEEATKIALEHLREQERLRHPGITIEVSEARCRLSMPQPDLGPVWFVRFALTLDEPEMRLRGEEVIVDGLTGAILTLGDLR